MITVLVRVEHGPEALAATLTALVPAVTAGLVGDAVILSDREDEILARVADAMGANLVVAEDTAWHRGAAVARREWLLCLDDGDIPQEGWVRVLDRFISHVAPGQRSARLRRGRMNQLRDVWDAMGRLIGRTSVRAGDLVHRRVLQGEKARAPVRLAARIERDPAFG